MFLILFCALCVRREHNKALTPSSLQQVDDDGRDADLRGPQRPLGSARHDVPGQQKF